jgi:hypothetical protein
MADRDKGSDIDKLLAEVDGMLTGGTPAKGPVAPSSSAEPSRGGFASQVRTAAVSGAVAAFGVWCVFAVLPFLAAPSGAVGAFLGTFAGVFIFRRRR